MIMLVPDELTEFCTFNLLILRKILQHANKFHLSLQKAFDWKMIKINKQKNNKQKNKNFTIFCFTASSVFNFVKAMVLSSLTDEESLLVQYLVDTQ